MLELHVNFRDVGLLPTKTNRGVRFGESHIYAFDSPVLDFVYETSGEVIKFVVGETVELNDEAPLSRVRSVEQIRVDCNFLKGVPRVTIARSFAGASPLYLSCNGNSVRASWRFEVAAEGLGSPEPNRDACIRFIEYGSTQTREQVLNGLQMIWPGEVVHLTPEGATFVDVPDFEVPASSTLTDDADVTGRFLDLVAASAATVVPRAGQTIIELSGGLDSTCVALATRRVIASPLASYGLIHQGAMGMQQRARRMELIRRLGLVDAEFPSDRWTPMAALDVEECSWTPHDDNHRMSCVAAVDAHPAGPFQLLLTGIGGDELTMEHTSDRFEFEVRGYASRSAIIGAMGRSDMFLRRGIWVKHPLIDNEVIAFCKALPKELRKGRILNILSIARSGISDGFLFPRYCEHYGAAMQWEGFGFDFDKFFVNSVIADYHIFDLTEVLNDAHDATYRGFSFELLGQLWRLAKLERVLRRYVG